MSDLPEWRKTIHGFAEHISRRAHPVWLPYKHLVFISEQIMENLDEGRIILNMPPRHGKSSLISRWLPVWFLEACPEKHVILTSHEATFAADWGRKVRDTFEHPQTWTTIRRDVSAANRWSTTEGGGMVTAGAGGAITGRDGNLLICDDLHKNWKQAQSPTHRKHLIEWFRSTLYTRAEPGATILIIQTRWHEDDLSGWLIREHSDDWKVISLPAVAEENDPLGREMGEALCRERYDERALAKQEKAVGSMAWAGMYQQRPRPAEGAIFKQPWIKYWHEWPQGIEKLIHSWDMSFKSLESSSYVVGQLWGKRGAEFFLLDQIRNRMSFVETGKALIAFSDRYPEARAKLVEDKANGPAIISALEKIISGLIEYSPRGSKEARAQAVAPLWEAGNVYVPSPDLYPWVGEYLDELLTFPSAANDDQVDATTQALDYLDAGSQIPEDFQFPDLTTTSPWASMRST